MFLRFFFFFPPKNFPLSLFHNLLLCQIFLLFFFSECYSVISTISNCFWTKIYSSTMRLDDPCSKYQITNFHYVTEPRHPFFHFHLFAIPIVRLFVLSRSSSTLVSPPCQSLSRIPVDGCNLRVEETSNFITILSVHVTRAHVLLPVIRVKGLVSR